MQKIQYVQYLCESVLTENHHWNGEILVGICVVFCSLCKCTSCKLYILHTTFVCVYVAE